MNKHHTVYRIAQVPPCQAVIMAKSILFGRTACLLRAFQCSVKTGFTDYHLRLVYQLSLKLINLVRTSTF